MVLKWEWWGHLTERGRNDRLPWPTLFIRMSTRHCRQSAARNSRHCSFIAAITPSIWLDRLESKLQGNVSVCLVQLNKDITFPLTRAFPPELCPKGFDPTPPLQLNGEQAKSQNQFTFGTVSISFVLPSYHFLGGDLSLSSDFGGVHERLSLRAQVLGGQLRDLRVRRHRLVGDDHP